MMSPGQASSTVSRSGAKNRIGLCTPMVLPVPDCFSFMPRRNSPDASRRNATRSRWLGSMLAWTLKTKPVTSLVARLDGTADGGLRARAAARMSASASSSSRTPKFFSAEPK